jgi:hypothetical protein
MTPGHTRSFVALLLTLGGLGVLGALVASTNACSSSSSDPGADNAPPGTYTFCEALHPACSPVYTPAPTACSRAASEQCDALESTRSEGFKNAVIRCAAKVSPCTLGFEECVTAEAAKATPTAAQLKVKDDFCAVCPDRDGFEACSTFFAAPEADAAADVGKGLTRLGAVVLGVNDAIAAEMEPCASAIAALPAADGGATLDSGSNVDGGPSDASVQGDASVAPPPCDVLAVTACMDAVRVRRTTPAACQADAG